MHIQSRGSALTQIEAAAAETQKADMHKDFRSSSLEYVRFVMERTKLSASALARLAGLSSTTLTRALNSSDHKFALTMTTLHKIREQTGFDYAPFLSMEMDEELRAEHVRSHPDEYFDGWELGESDSIAIAGEVAAGVWREVQYISDKPLGALHLAPTSRSLRQRMVALLVRGESLNRIARDDDVLLVEDLRQTRGDVRDGDLVIVERRRGQEGTVEVTAKRLRNRGRELWPESDDPRFQEPLRIGSGGDDDVAEIIGLVHYIVRKP